MIHHPALNRPPFRVGWQFFDPGKGDEEEIGIRLVPTHNPCVGIQLLNRHRAARRQLRRHDQTPPVINQGRVHNGSFPQCRCSVKGAPGNINHGWTGMDTDFLKKEEGRMQNEETDRSGARGSSAGPMGK